MVLRQSAASAAVVALNEGTRIQQVDLTMLAEGLQLDGQVTN